VKKFKGFQDRPSEVFTIYPFRKGELEGILREFWAELRFKVAI
jgi:hypothetical protein